MIRAKDPRLHRITVTEHGFLLPEGSSAQRGATLAGSSSSHQAVEAKGVKAKSEEQVVELGQSEDEFGAFDQVDLSEDPSSDLGDPSLTESDLLRTSSQAEMSFKKKPPTSLFDLIEGQPRKDIPGKTQPKLPLPPPKPQPAQTRSSSTLSQPSSPRSKLPPPPQSANPKRKRDSKGKKPMDGGRSHSSQEEDEARRTSKQLKIVHQGQDKEVTTQSEPQAWLLAPVLHEEPLMDNASLRDFRGGEGAYVADALERSLLLPTDMAELRGLRRQEVFLSIKRYLGMVRLPTFVILVILVLWFPTHRVLVSIGRLSRLPTS